jgi:hypothetical protein
MNEQLCSLKLTLTPAALLQDKGLTYGQLAHRYTVSSGKKISRQAINQVVRGQDNSSDVRVFVARQLGFRPSTLWRGLVADDLLAFDDFIFGQQK